MPRFLTSAAAVLFVLACTAGPASAANGSLGIIVEKDLFRPSRQKPKPPRKSQPRPKVEPVVVLPPPKSPPPRLVLSGTVLLDSGSVALMSLQGAPGASGRYAVGDRIEDFVVTEILGESVVLKRDDEVLRVDMGSGQRQGAYSRALPERQAVAGGPPADIPPALVPMAQSPFQRALPYRQNAGSRQGN